MQNIKLVNDPESSSIINRSRAGRVYEERTMNTLRATCIAMAINLAVTYNVTNKVGQV